MQSEAKGAASGRRQTLRAGVDTPYKALSIDEAAAVAGIVRSTLYAMIRAGDGPKLTRIGQRSVIFLRDFEEWAEGLRAKAA